MTANTNSYIANLIEKLHAIAASNSDLRAAERKTCTDAADALRNSHDGPSDKADAERYRYLRDAPHPSNAPDHPWIAYGVVGHLTMLTQEYADSAVDFARNKPDATLDKEKLYRQWGKDDVR